MKIKKPEIFLTNSKKEICWHCKEKLICKEKTFDMKGSNSNPPKKVTENLLYCPKCSLFYVTQDICVSLSRKYKGYYVDASIYQLKKKKVSNKTTSTVSTSNTNNSALDSSAKKETKVISDSLHGTRSMLTAPVFLSNTYNVENSICPKCNSVLIPEKVNVPVLFENGDFYRYFAETVLYCHRCKKGFLSKKSVNKIIDKILLNSHTNYTINLTNAKISRNKNNDYLYYPTMENDTSIFFPNHDYSESSLEFSDGINLASESFLGKMGYTVSKHTDARHNILKKAVAVYGKRKVADHIAFLISTRKNQVNGTIKYANAIRVWQSDLNYISSLAIPLSK